MCTYVYIYIYKDRECGGHHLLWMNSSMKISQLGSFNQDGGEASLWDTQIPGNSQISQMRRCTHKMRDNP